MNVLEGCKKTADGRYIIHESRIVVPRKMPIKESMTDDFPEQAVGKSSAYEFEIWDYNKNGNGRNYSNVIPVALTKFKNVRTLTMMNHPEGDDIDLNDNMGVAWGPHMKDGWLCVYWVPTTRKGDDWARTFDAGGPACVSSSIFGNADGQGYILNDETFEIDRWFDAVYDPSNRVVHFCDGHTEMKEELEKENTILTNSAVAEENKNSDNKTVESMEEQMAETITEAQNKKVDASLTLNVRGLIKESMKLEGKAKIEALQEARVFAENISDPSAIMEEIDSAIAEENKKILEFAEKGKGADVLENKLSATEAELAEVKDNASKIIESEKEHCEKAIMHERAKADEMIKEAHEDTLMAKSRYNEEKEAITEQLNKITELYETELATVKTLKVENNTLRATVTAMEDEMSSLKNAVKHSNVVKEAKVNSGFVSVAKYEEALNEIKQLRRKLISRVQETADKSFAGTPVQEKVFAEPKAEPIQESKNEELDQDAIMEAILAGKASVRNPIHESNKEVEMDDEDRFMASMIK